MERSAELDVELARAARRRDELTRRAGALDLLLVRLTDHRLQLTRKLQAPLQRHLNRYLQLLFPEASLSVDEALVPEIVGWQQELRGKVSFALITSGNEKENQAKFGDKFHLMLVQEARELSDLIGAKWTPTAVLMGADRRIASHAAAGDVAIRELVATIKKDDPAREFVFYTNGNGTVQTLKIGEPVPDMAVTDITGRELNAADLKGKQTLVASWSTGCSVELFASAGPGFGGEPGTPVVRAYLGLAYANAPLTQPPCVEGREYDLAACPELDKDGDGVKNATDKEPLVAEDKDGFQDEDGAPELDNDQDGVADADDKCRDVRGVKENGGCPDVDTDKDGLVDRLDKCVNDVEDKDGFEDADGCPETNNDGDGVLDAKDACPLVKGLARDGGCPPKDGDNDGVVDAEDNCPTEAGVKENSGCPAAKKQLVVITGLRLEARNGLRCRWAPSSRTR